MDLQTRVGKRPRRVPHTSLCIQSGARASESRRSLRPQACDSSAAQAPARTSSSRRPGRAIGARRGEGTRKRGGWERPEGGCGSGSRSRTAAYSAWRYGEGNPTLRNPGPRNRPISQRIVLTKSLFGPRPLTNSCLNPWNNLQGKVSPSMHQNNPLVSTSTMFCRKNDCPVTRNRWKSKWNKQLWAGSKFLKITGTKKPFDLTNSLQNS